MMRGLVRALWLATACAGAMWLIGVSVRDLIRADRARRREAAANVRVRAVMETTDSTGVHDPDRGFVFENPRPSGDPPLMRTLDEVNARRGHPPEGGEA
jgi:hypothetical protein